MMPSPSQLGRVAKFRSVPSWMHSTVSWPRIRCSVRARCGRENVPGRDRRRHRLVDEPVVALDRRAVVGRVGGDRLAGQRRQQPLRS